LRLNALIKMNTRITLPLLLLGFSALANSTSAAAAEPPAEAATTNNEVRHWFAFRPARDDFQETILDCSRWVEAPTGRHGLVTAKGDRFVFEDGTPVRFWGAQMNLWGRRAAAEIYSSNVHIESIRAVCAANLKNLSNDPSNKVRQPTTAWLRNRRGEWTKWQRDLLLDFVRSPAFDDGPAERLTSLDDTPSHLPPEFMTFAEKAVGLIENALRLDPPAAFRYTNKLPGLVVRFYEQSTEPGTRRQCLDLMDRLLSLGIGEIDAELNKADR